MKYKDIFKFLILGLIIPVVSSQHASMGGRNRGRTSTFSRMQSDHRFLGNNRLTGNDNFNGRPSRGRSNTHRNMNTRQRPSQPDGSQRGRSEIIIEFRNNRRHPEQVPMSRRNSLDHSRSNTRPARIASSSSNSASMRDNVRFNQNVQDRRNLAGHDLRAQGNRRNPNDNFMNRQNARNEHQFSNQRRHGDSLSRLGHSNGQQLSSQMNHDTFGSSVSVQGQNKLDTVSNQRGSNFGGQGQLNNEAFAGKQSGLGSNNLSPNDLGHISASQNHFDNNNNLFGTNIGFSGHFDNSHTRPGQINKHQMDTNHRGSSNQVIDNNLVGANNIANRQSNLNSNLVHSHNSNNIPIGNSHTSTHDASVNQIGINQPEVNSFLNQQGVSGPININLPSELLGSVNAPIHNKEHSSVSNMLSGVNVASQSHDGLTTGSSGKNGQTSKSLNSIIQAGLHHTQIHNGHTSPGLQSTGTIGNPLVGQIHNAVATNTLNQIQPKSTNHVNQNQPIHAVHGNIYNNAVPITAAVPHQNTGHSHASSNIASSLLNNVSHVLNQLTQGSIQASNNAKHGATLKTSIANTGATSGIHTNAATIHPHVPLDINNTIKSLSNLIASNASPGLKPLPSNSAGAHVTIKQTGNHPVSPISGVGAAPRPVVEPIEIDYEEILQRAMAQRILGGLDHYTG